MHHFYLWIVENILLESFPVSSSGHIMLLEELLEQKLLFFNGFLVNKATVEHVLHLPIAIIVALFFLPRWWPFLCKLHKYWFVILKIVIFTFLVDCITIVWFLLFRVIGIDWLPLWAGFSMTALLLFFEKRLSSKRSRLTLSWQTILFFGCLQGIALLPGISRLAITYMGGRFLGVSPKKAFGISWLIVCPLLCAASFRGTWELYNQQQLSLLVNNKTLCVIGLVTIAAFGALYFVSYLARTGRLWYFAIYLVIPIAISFLVYLDAVS